MDYKVLAPLSVALCCPECKKILGNGQSLALELRIGNLGRRRQPEHLINARRRIQNASNFWYPIVCELCGLFIAVARIVVNNDSSLLTMLQGGLTLSASW